MELMHVRRLSPLLMRYAGENPYVATILTLSSSRCLPGVVAFYLCAVLRTVLEKQRNGEKFTYLF